MSGKRVKQQRRLERKNAKPETTEVKQQSSARRFNWGILGVLLLSVISLTAFGFSKGFQSDDNLPAVSETTESTSVRAYQLDIDNEEVTPETWRSINLEMRKADGSIAKVDLLRPLWWLEEAKAGVGGTIVLSMPEMGIEGDAKVLSIRPCKADSRKGDPKYRVVTGKFTHENAIVLDLHFNNNPNDPLGVTPNHPLWSQTRNDWVEAGQLKVGEYVKTKDGIAQLTMRSQRPGRHKVYNLEVHKDHTYYVSNLGILAHNSCANDVKVETPRQALRQAKRDAGIPTSQTHVTHNKNVRTDRLGGTGDDLVFENGKTIQHHKTGHDFPENPKPPHFNNHPETKNHYIYEEK